MENKSFRKTAEQNPFAITPKEAAIDNGIPAVITLLKGKIEEITTLLSQGEKFSKTGLGFDPQKIKIDNFDFTKNKEELSKKVSNDPDLKPYVKIYTGRNTFAPPISFDEKALKEKAASLTPVVAPVPTLPPMHKEECRQRLLNIASSASVEDKLTQFSLLLKDIEVRGKQLQDKWLIDQLLESILGPKGTTRSQIGGLSSIGNIVFSMAQLGITSKQPEEIQATLTNLRTYLISKIEGKSAKAPAISIAAQHRDALINAFRNDLFLKSYLELDKRDLQIVPKEEAISEAEKLLPKLAFGPLQGVINQNAQLGNCMDLEGASAVFKDLAEVQDEQQFYALVEYAKTITVESSELKDKWESFLPFMQKLTGISKHTPPSRSAHTVYVPLFANITAEIVKKNLGKQFAAPMAPTWPQQEQSYMQPPVMEQVSSALPPSYQESMASSSIPPVYDQVTAQAPLPVPPSYQDSVANTPPAYEPRIIKDSAPVPPSFNEVMFNNTAPAYTAVAELPKAEVRETISPERKAFIADLSTATAQENIMTTDRQNAAVNATPTSQQTERQAFSTSLNSAPLASRKISFTELTAAKPVSYGQLAEQKSTASLLDKLPTEKRELLPAFSKNALAKEIVQAALVEGPISKKEPYDKIAKLLKTVPKSNLIDFILNDANKGALTKISKDFPQQEIKELVTKVEKALGTDNMQALLLTGDVGTAKEHKQDLVDSIKASVRSCLPKKSSDLASVELPAKEISKSILAVKGGVLSKGVSPEAFTAPEMGGFEKGK